LKGSPKKIEDFVKTQDSNQASTLLSIELVKFIINKDWLILSLIPYKLELGFGILK